MERIDTIKFKSQDLPIQVRDLEGCSQATLWLKRFPCYPVLRRPCLDYKTLPC